MQLQYGWSSWYKSKLLITDKAICIHVGNYAVPYHRFLKFAQDTRQAHRSIVTGKLSVPFLENWRDICCFPYRGQLSLLHCGWEDIQNSGLAMAVATSSRTLGCILSGPGDLVVFRARSFFFIFSSVNMKWCVVAWDWGLHLMVHL